MIRIILNIIKRLGLNLKVRLKSLFTLQEMGFEPCFELEKLVNKPGFLANFLNTDNKDHFCSVHKAVIPIARMRVLLDQDDVGDSVSFRCPEC